LEAGALLHTVPRLLADARPRRKPVWARLEAGAHDALRATMFMPVTAAAAQRCLQARSLGVARLRLLPKRDGALAARAPREPSQAPALSLGLPAVGGSLSG